MFVQSKQQAAFIDKVAERLTEIFAKPLYQLSQERNYSTHVGSLAEIIEWSWEFFDQYYDKLGNWKSFKSSNENIFKADNLEEFVVAFGHVKFIKYCIEKKGQ